MGSEANKMNEATTFQPTEPTLCLNGCGFFGSASTQNLCSKCFRDVQLNEEQTVSAKSAMEKLVNKVVSLPTVAAPTTSSVSVPESVEEEQPRTVSNRCMSCKKKVGVMGFKCKCGDVFCGSHRYPEQHECVFDFKKTGKDAIMKANPVVKADKVNRI